MVQVHYDPGQEYTAHHDFSMPKLVHLQPSRFATILFYLNDDMEGGETAFPRWLNAETTEPLKVKPKKVCVDKSTGLLGGLKW